MSRKRIIVIASVGVLATALGVAAHFRKVALDRTLSAVCASNMISICSANLMYASVHENTFPTKLSSLEVVLSTPHTFVCPGNDSNPLRMTRNWADVDKYSDYEIVSPGMLAADKDKVFIRCKIHGHLGYSDMTVFDGVRRRGKFE